MKNVFSNSWKKNPHSNEGKEGKETPFFSKHSKKPFFNAANGDVVQTKLTVGQPGDKYEKEADTMADAVVNNTSKPDIQNKEISSIQRESLATPQEDEKLGTAEQRMEEDKLVQEKPEIQKMGGEEEEELQAKSISSTSNQTTSKGLSQQIKNKSGKGKSLPKKTKAEMEASFEHDFSSVNIHTDQDAVAMNKELSAQAFTYGSDVYFNTGKYNPDSTSGKQLLAHELTHVVQQGKSTKKKSIKKKSQVKEE
ncbi:eCIS core domain-containing protein [Aquimarina mytili]|uniref:DUF4157 domain-containing protein n=1 Tax=Aquimarina mytili TaxID=874423 RepID=A0A937DAS0_9FLAO|nr:DUF4157 domain-containing protein [Aquimarina mytili]MBL0683833.1 DUF4157 domain-containing protein [Aquimarina mytili]